MRALIRGWMRFVTGASHRELTELTEEITSAHVAKATAYFVAAVSLLYFGTLLMFSM